ncbi:hypothetical protein KUCAC02_015829 [Chaenocephalus aceratus]|uniref:Uncharacterized protein n=1 Tax=Chaenocephalus aceratus TaxID=36190 RepID=A0ACB9Y011_CHAAC|nr:hypothetical protein KUCAC02_015829 [Chaenocephalus aceratus]
MDETSRSSLRSGTRVISATVPQSPPVPGRVWKHPGLGGPYPGRQSRGAAGRDSRSWTGAARRGSRTGNEFPEDPSSETSSERPSEPSRRASTRRGSTGI